MLPPVRGVHVTSYKNPAPMFSSEGKISLNEVTGDELQRIKTIKPASPAVKREKWSLTCPSGRLYIL